MTLRDKVTRSILKKHPIPKELQNSRYVFYYKDYADNLFCPMGKSALEAYAKGNGNETKPQTINKNGTIITTPAKMASIASSSAMTFNLLGNEPAIILTDNILPCGTYDVEYEKRMHTLAHGNRPAHLDAFLSDEANKTAIFCEMKMLEWLGEPSKISETYFTDKYFFKPDEDAVPFSKDAFDFFLKWAQVLKNESFRRYDAWQMFKHLLAIYNYTSFVTEASVNEFDRGRSMAGKYNDIILVNVVNEFPVELIEDEEVRTQYARALNEEREEAKIFRDTMKYCSMPWIFDNNCHSGIRIEYISTKQFADSLEMSDEKREYLKRYYS